MNGFCDLVRLEASPNLALELNRYLYMRYPRYCNGFLVSGEGVPAARRTVRHRYGNLERQRKSLRSQDLSFHPFQVIRIPYFERVRNWWKLPQIFSKNSELQRHDLVKKPYRQRLQHNANRCLSILIMF